LRFSELNFEKQNDPPIFASLNMRIFTEETIKKYAEKHPDSRVALQNWAQKVKQSDWSSFADIKKTFNNVDSVGDQHYVFNIKGNDFRLVAVVKFTIKFVYIRFIGTHVEYDKIKAKRA
jgi:mRNA interferase HigB